ncbi:MAG: phage tail length tape measure family protein [Verrucomicrobia subdivision 3 bacterium]|nr:phage tail length tape measure family protein [Limisphaerales bacterium]
MASGNKKIGYEIHAEDKTGPGANSAKRNLQSIGDQLRSLQNLGIGTLGLHELGSAVAAVHTSALEAEKSAAALNAVLKATGGSAGLTKRQIEGLVDELTDATLFDDEALREAAAALLRFRDIQEDVFEDALRLAPDVATALGIDVTSAAQLLGKAAVNTETGLKGLRAAGLQLSPQLEDIAKKFSEAGDKAGGARIVFNELKKSIGGAAGEANTGLLKSSADTKKAWNELLEAIGNTKTYQSSATIVLGALTHGMTDLKVRVEESEGAFSSLFSYLRDNSELLALVTGKGLAPPKLKPSPPAPGRERSGKITTVDGVPIDEARAQEAAAQRRKEQQEEAEYERKKKLAEEARKRGEQEAKQRDAALKRMQERGQQNELDAYYESGGEETMRETAAKREREAAEAAYRESERQRKALDDLVKSRREDAEAQQLEYDLIRESEPVRRARVAMLDAERMGVDRNSDAWSTLYDSTLKAEEQRDAIRKVNDEIKRGENFARDFGMTFQSAAEDAILEGKNLLEVVQALGKDIGRIMLRKTVTEPLGEGISGMVRNSGIFSGIGDWVRGLFRNADGGVYASPSLHHYANGVYDSPRLFAFASGGVFAEAGPEAVMPLARDSSGRLGVQAHGAAAAPVITLNQHINSDSRTDQASIRTAMAMAKNEAIAAIRRSLREGGEFARATGVA